MTINRYDVLHNALSRVRDLKACFGPGEDEEPGVYRELCAEEEILEAMLAELPDRYYPNKNREFIGWIDYAPFPQQMILHVDLGTGKITNETRRFDVPDEIEQVWFTGKPGESRFAREGNSRDDLRVAVQVDANNEVMSMRWYAEEDEQPCPQ